MVEFATSTYLGVLGLNPSAGRWFTPDEDRPGAEAVAVLGHHAWTTTYGASPSVIGEAIRINGVPVTVVGVGPAGLNSGFRFGAVTGFWLPAPSIVTVTGAPGQLDRDAREAPFLVKARLRDGVSVPRPRRQ